MRVVYNKMNKKPKQIIWGLIILFILISPSFLFAELYKINNDRVFKDFTLLLNSGLTSCETSNVKYILWTEDRNELSTLNNIVQDSPLVWQKEVISDFRGVKVYKFFSENQVDKEEEKLIHTQLQYIEEQLKGSQILLYFHQQIEDRIDVWHYLSLNEIKKTQQTTTDKLLSITGYCNTISKVLYSNTFDTNVQLITNKQTNKGKTILAIPALLEDF